MLQHSKSSVFKLSIFIAAFGSNLAIAQQKEAPRLKVENVAARTMASQPAKPAFGPEPETTTASYGDWVLRCQRTAEAAKQSCEIVHSVLIDGQTGPIMQLAVGAAEGGPIKQVVIVLPPNVSLSVTPELKTSETSKAQISKWSRCLPGACFAQIDLNDIEVWEGDGRGSVTFTDATNRKLSLPFSLRGFHQAFEALEKL